MVLQSLAGPWEDKADSLHLHLHLVCDAPAALFIHGPSHPFNDRAKLWHPAWYRTNLNFHSTWTSVLRCFALLQGPQAEKTAPSSQLHITVSISISRTWPTTGPGVSFVSSDPQIQPTTPGSQLIDTYTTYRKHLRICIRRWQMALLLGHLRHSKFCLNLLSIHHSSQLD